MTDVTPPASPGVPDSGASSPRPLIPAKSGVLPGFARPTDAAVRRPAAAPTDGLSKPSAKRGQRAQWNLPAAVAGWVLPGLGHLLIGQTRRGLVLAITIGTLWLIGLLLGGLSVVDRDDHPAWFLGQMLLAPSLAADRYRQHLVESQEQAYFDEMQRGIDVFVPAYDPPFEPAFGRPQEQGTLFTCVAGLLNLLAIIDVLYRDPRLARDAPRHTPLRAGRTVNAAGSEA